VITKADGWQVRNVGELELTLRAKQPEKTITVSVIRKGVQISISVELE